MIKLVIPKGSLEEQTLALLRDADLPVRRSGDREYNARIDDERISQVAILTDEVDPEQIARPRPWSMNEITRFILFIGPCSSLFDYTTYFVMLYVFRAWEPSQLTALV